jgi:predicted permease
VRSARIDEGYFDTTGIGIVKGRAFRTTDRADAPRVAVVNTTLATHYWPGQDVIGKRFRMNEGERPWVEIVGVAADAKYQSIAEPPTEFTYYARDQYPAPQSTLLVATEDDAAALTAPLREAVRTIDPNMPVFEVRTMTDFYHANIVSSDVLVQTVGVMGSMGLALAMAGLYGLVAYSVSRRTREIGIRIAVGANPRSVLQMVLRQGLQLAIAGGVVGIVGSVAMGRLLRIAFPSAGNIDLGTYLVVVPALLAITLFAAYIPARRAARIDPLVALRQD